MNRVNPWLRERLEKLHSPEKLELIIETEPELASTVARDLLKIPNTTLQRERIAWARFVPISAPREAIPQIRQIPGVKEIHYNTPKTIRHLSIFDPLLGEVRLSTIEIPGTPLETVAIIPFSPIAEFLDLAKPGYEFIPTSQIRELIKAPADNTITTKVACLDTGAIAPFHPLANRRVEAQSVIAEPPLDLLGHGVFCHTTAFLGESQTRFGRVKGVADALNSLHVKCLDNRGFGDTQSVLLAMQAAYSWGAKVVSMSLGGPLQGSALQDDPESKIIKETSDEVIWVVAAGNEGTLWSIASPGTAPDALTVGSYSPKYGDVSVFSSRGPSGRFYRDHHEAWERDLSERGEDLSKPDILAPGGGPCKIGQTPIDMIYSGSQGWTDGQFDLTPADGFAAMRGSSMATAVAAGLVALLVEKKGVHTAQEIKAVMRSYGEKDSVRGYGLMIYDLF